MKQHQNGFDGSSFDDGGTSDLNQDFFKSGQSEEAMIETSMPYLRYAVNHLNVK